ncbi:MAG: hypothetical protein U9R58_13920 [Chloroflexota bacterium]|nr:hypothetical protein [Chloroflexota bacterium]
MELKRPSLVKPTQHTPFHIDFDWWTKNDRDWRIYLQGFLCPEHQKAYADLNIDETIDWVDPETAEVQQVDGLQHVLITHCAKDPSFITHQTTLVDSVFRIFLSNGNVPQTPLELNEQLGKPANTILKTFSGVRVYRGIRPCLE